MQFRIRRNIFFNADAEYKFNELIRVYLFFCQQAGENGTVVLEVMSAFFNSLFNGEFLAVNDEIHRPLLGGSEQPGAGRIESIVHIQDEVGDGHHSNQFADLLQLADHLFPFIILDC